MWLPLRCAKAPNGAYALQQLAILRLRPAPDFITSAARVSVWPVRRRVCECRIEQAGGSLEEIDSRLRQFTGRRRRTARFIALPSTPREVAANAVKLAICRRQVGGISVKRVRARHRGWRGDARAMDSRCCDQRAASCQAVSRTAAAHWRAIRSDNIAIPPAMNGAVPRAIQRHRHNTSLSSVVMRNALLHRITASWLLIVSLLLPSFQWWTVGSDHLP